MNYETTVTAETADAYPADLIDEAAARSTRRRWIVIIAIIALVVLGAIAFFLTRGGESGAVAAGDDQSQAPAVTVVSPGRGTIEGEISASGTLAARRPIPVGSVGEGGRVLSVPVDAGDWVRRGQVLVVIDSAVQVQQIASARANIQVAQADANLAQADLDRALQLVDRGFISQADVDRLTATRDAARARVAVARAQLGELQARTARLNVYAPASGLVLERNVEPGQTVSGGGTPLFTIASGGEMEMLARVSETDLAKLSLGTEAAVIPVGTDRRFSGQIWQLSPTIDEANRQGTARIALPYAPQLRRVGQGDAARRLRHRGYRQRNPRGTDASRIRRPFRRRGRLRVHRRRREQGAAPRGHDRHRHGGRHRHRQRPHRRRAGRAACRRLPHRRRDRVAEEGRHRRELTP